MPLRELPLTSTTITSPFWSHIQTNSRTKTVPAIISAQKEWDHWTCLTWKRGHSPQPHQFWDSDIYKIVEAACYFLTVHPEDTQTMSIVEEAVDMIRNAQYEDGYINSYYTVKGIEDRWTNLRDNHELYCLGHLLEATVAYEKLTNSGRLLEVAKRVCEHVDSVFGTEPGKKRGYPGHQEIEIGLLRLYELTGDALPLKLARYFILERGQRDDKDEIYFDKEAFARGADPYAEMGSEHKAWYSGTRDYRYHQADQPLADATEVKGHSVRAMYFYTAATDLVRLCASSDPEVARLQPALDRLWRDMVDKKMYITGGLGSVTQWEGFGPAFQLGDLECEGCYAETCATFALINWCSRMLRLNLDSEYADIMEIALYNGLLGAVNQDGDAFYYQNVMRTVSGQPKERSKWFGVACCPPNVAKLLGNLSSTIYSFDPENSLLAIHQYIDSELHIPGTDIIVTQKTNMPWDGTVSITTSGTGTENTPITLALRIPSWATDSWSCSTQGKLTKGYLYISPSSSSSSESNAITLTFPTTPRKIYTNPLTGKDEICITRGPLVYCIEEPDNPSLDIDHLKLFDSQVKDGTEINIGGMNSVSIKCLGKQLVKEEVAGEKKGLYTTSPWRYDSVPREVIAIPYFLRSNRGGDGAMRVWTPRVEGMVMNGH